MRAIVMLAQLDGGGITTFAAEKSADVAKVSDKIKKSGMVKIGKEDVKVSKLSIIRIDGDFCQLTSNVRL